MPSDRNRTLLLAFILTGVPLHSLVGSAMGCDMKRVLLSALVLIRADMNRSPFSISPTPSDLNTVPRLSHSLSSVGGFSSLSTAAGMMVFLMNSMSLI